MMVTWYCPDCNRECAFPEPELPANARTAGLVHLPMTAPACFGPENPDYGALEFRPHPVTATCMRDPKLAVKWHPSLAISMGAGQLTVTGEWMRHGGR
jgi:hypothetical protein